MAAQISERSGSTRLKRLLIPVLIILVFFSIVFLYLLPMLETQPQSVYVDPSEFHIRTFNLDSIMEETDFDFIYRGLASNPFEPMEVLYMDDDFFYELEEEEPIPLPETIPYRLTGILTVGSRRQAILEGDGESFILKEGDSFNKFMVVEINRDTVMVRSEGSMYRFLLGGGYGESI